MNKLSLSHKIDDLNVDELYQLTKGIFRCIELSDSKVELNISERDLENGLDGIFENFYFTQFDFAMKDLGEKNVIDWMAFAHDDYMAPDFVFEFNRKTFEFIRLELLDKFYGERAQLLKTINELENKLDLIYGFNPEKINDDIKKANERATELLTTIKNNEMLASLEKQVSEYTNYLNKIHGINKIYNDVYLNIVKPVKDEGKKGVKATALWAVVSIIIATIVSIAISNWTFIKDIYTKIF